MTITPVVLSITTALTLSMSLPPRIDVHSHFLPPFYRDALASNGHSHPDGMPAIPSWSPSDHLSMMRTANVSKSILSISSPGTNIVAGNTTLTRDLTRQCNAYAAKMKRDDPEKFGFWASLPLPDVDAALDEIDEKRDQVRCLVITGAGRAFCTGANLQGRNNSVTAAPNDVGSPWAKARNSPPSPIRPRTMAPRLSTRSGCSVGPAIV